MSTDWGYRCETCNLNSETWLNHGEAALDSFHSLWPHLREVVGNQWLDIRIPGVYDYPGPLEFLSEHFGHRICLRNEYGDTEAMAAAPTMLTEAAPS